VTTQKNPFRKAFTASHRKLADWIVESLVRDPKGDYWYMESGAKLPPSGKDASDAEVKAIISNIFNVCDSELGVTKDANIISISNQRWATHQGVKPKYWRIILTPGNLKAAQRQPNGLRAAFHRDRVMFRFNDDQYDPILAVFPDLKENRAGDVTCYAHIGQHSACSMEYVLNDTKPASPAEYAPLKRELERIGYNLDVIDSDPFRLPNGLRRGFSLTVPRNIFGWRKEKGMLPPTYEVYTVLHPHLPGWRVAFLKIAPGAAGKAAWSYGGGMVDPNYGITAIRRFDTPTEALDYLDSAIASQTPYPLRKPNGLRRGLSPKKAEWDSTWGVFAMPNWNPIREVKFSRVYPSHQDVEQQFFHHYGSKPQHIIFLDKDRIKVVYRDSEFILTRLEFLNYTDPRKLNPLRRVISTTIPHDLSAWTPDSVIWNPFQSWVLTHPRRKDWKVMIADIPPNQFSKSSPRVYAAGMVDPAYGIVGVRRFKTLGEAFDYLDSQVSSATYWRDPARKPNGLRSGFQKMTTWTVWHHCAVVGEIVLPDNPTRDAMMTAFYKLTGHLPRVATRISKSIIRAEFHDGKVMDAERDFPGRLPNGLRRVIDGGLSQVDFGDMHRWNVQLPSESWTHVFLPKDPTARQVAKAIHRDPKEVFDLSRKLMGAKIIIEFDDGDIYTLNRVW
jgi:hypothetical protein